MHCSQINQTYMCNYHEHTIKHRYTNGLQSIASFNATIFVYSRFGHVGEMVSL